MKLTKTQKKDKLLRYILDFCILTLGIAVGIAIRHYYNIPVVETINIVEVATLIVTVFLAVYIPGVFDRQLQVKKDKKELIEKRLEELQSLYYRINQIVQQEEVSQKAAYIIDNTLEIAKNRLNIITTLMNYLTLNIAFEEELREIMVLDNSYRTSLLQAIEQGPEAIFSDEMKAHEEDLYNKIDQSTSLLIFKINDI